LFPVFVRFLLQNLAFAGHLLLMEHAAMTWFNAAKSGIGLDGKFTPRQRPALLVIPTDIK